jgi:hypothetical protein
VTALTGSSTVRLHALRLRRDGDDWYVGRPETGDFIVLPDIGVRVIGHVGNGLSIGQARDRLRAETGRDVDVLDFVAGLRELGMVAAVDGHPIPGAEPIRPTLAWLRPEHVRWALHPALSLAVLGALLSTLVGMLATGQLPSGRDLVWSDRASFVLAGNAGLAWMIIFLHELGHLVTARAAGVPGRMSLGTRLQFLVAQTDVSGIWVEPRRTRIIVYLAGITVNLVIAAIGVWLKLVIPPGTIHTGLAAMVVVALVLIPPQLLVFMRTDLYFLIQDLARCRNLYADGSAYARYQLHLVWRWITRSGRVIPDPSAGLRGAERRAVRRYAALLVLGTAACLAVFFAVTVPVLEALIVPAVGRLLGRPSTQDILDAGLLLLLVGGFQLLWVKAWWKRHGGQVQAWRQGHGKE